MDIRFEGLVAGGEATLAWVVALLILLGVGLALLCQRAIRHRRARSAGQAAAAREQMEHALAERLRNERSRLLSAVAHDLRQPLYAMSLTTQSLEQQRAVRSPAVLLSQMRHALASADALLDTLDTVARLETGALRPRLAVFSMQAMLERIDRQYGPQAQARGLHWTVTPSLECVHTDALLLERMLDSLVANAVHCTERGGVLVSCRRRGQQLLLQVWDTGPGLDPVGLATAGGPHYRDDGGVAADGGVGFGLAVVKHAARLLGIRLSVRSRVGHGTCFSLLLPLYPVASRRRVARLGTRQPQFSA